ncbi:TRAP transporter small permease [Paenalcaligenes niemegkensis]|uniref:TRAP transporter small permease n=1 Tax=Paenalcaligenes niemegkensis TaxID=2895469 RepID=UPI001EE952B9|nr:TRAP transporter small permease [Paenalcaligenes niemegkensis]MCQ9618279.1 TRAP transporter small permease [Paenalcaligenes niemegkensis]
MFFRIYHRSLDLMAGIAALLILLVTLGISVDVFTRYITGRPIIWMFDVSQYVLLYIPCLGMAWLAREQGHIAITTFVEMASPSKVAAIRLLTTLASAITCSVIAYWAWIVLFEKISSGSVFVQAIEVPESWVYWVIPVGFSMTAFEFFRQLKGKPYVVESKLSDQEPSA